MHPHDERPYSYCPMCGGGLEPRSLKATEPERLVCVRCGFVFYLDPKLVEQGSAESTFRTFYFEPKNETLKITDDAVHLLVGIEHDGKERAWTFTGWRLVDLSKLRVRLKAEFQAGNAELYQKSELFLPASRR